MDFAWVKQKVRHETGAARPKQYDMFAIAFADLRERHSAGILQCSDQKTVCFQSWSLWKNEKRFAKINFIHFSGTNTMTDFYGLAGLRFNGVDFLFCQNDIRIIPGRIGFDDFFRWNNRLADFACSRHSDSALTT